MALKDIDTIVICMLENRSFDHMLGYLSLDDAPKKLPVDGLRSDSTWQASWRNRDDGGVPLPLRPLTASTEIDDPPHGRDKIKMQIETPAEGRPHMGGFVKAYLKSRRDKQKPPPADPGAVMGYYKADAVPTFDFLARNYCVCDRWFAPLPLGTQANRLMAMAGESEVIDNETGLPNQPLVYNWLKNRAKWRVYQWGKYFPFFTMMNIWAVPIATSLATNGDKFRRYAKFKKNWTTAREMPAVIFIEPDYTDGLGSSPNDDHPPTGVAGGQALIRDIYETLISNPARWAKTLFIVTYDEHGGFFDHVPPLPISTTIRGETFGTTGPRVPALLVSPHVGKGVVFSEPLDHTAILQLLTERFGKGQGYSLAVNQRLSQNVLGRLSNALKAPRTGKAPSMGEPIEIKAAAVEGPAGATKTTNGRAFDQIARQLAAEHPELVDAETKAFLESNPPPDIESGDHIP
jgi:phospholipase C